MGDNLFALKVSCPVDQLCVDDILHTYSSWHLLCSFQCVTLIYFILLKFGGKCGCCFFGLKKMLFLILHCKTILFFGVGGH